MVWAWLVRCLVERQFEGLSLVTVAIVRNVGKDAVNESDHLPHRVQPLFRLGRNLQLGGHDACRPRVIFFGTAKECC